MLNRTSIKDILFSNLFIAGISLLGFWRSIKIWELNLPLLSYFIVFFSTFLTYSTASLIAESSNQTLKGYWNLTHPNWSKFSFLLSIIVLTLLFFLNPKLFIPLLPVGLITLYYILSSSKIFAKQTAYFKTTILSISWWYVMDVYPLLLISQPFQAQHYGWFILDWAYIHLICFYFDYRDHQHEKQPYLIFDQHKFPIIVPLLCALFFSIGGYLFLIQPAANHSFLFYKSLLFLSLLFTYPISTKTHSYFWFYLILDGSLAADALFFW